MTEPLGRNRKSRLRYAMDRDPMTHNMETSIGWRGAIFDNFQTPWTLTFRKKFTVGITHRPLPAYQVSCRSDERSVTDFEYGFIKSFFSGDDMKKGLRNGNFGAYAIKRVAAVAHLRTPWLFEPAERQDDRADYCLDCSFVPYCKHRVLVFTVEWTGARPSPLNWVNSGEGSAQ